MAADTSHNSEATGMDMPAHVRNYEGFIRFVKYGAIAAFVIGAIVVLIISR